MEFRCLLDLTEYHEICDKRNIFTAQFGNVKCCLERRNLKINGYKTNIMIGKDGVDGDITLNIYLIEDTTSFTYLDVTL